MPSTGWPCSCAGTNGSGGAVITAQPVDTSSGAASAQSRQPRRTSGRTIDGEHHQPGEHDRAERMQPELELGHDAEVAAAAADAPEQVGVLVARSRVTTLAVGE